MLTMRLRGKGQLLIFKDILSLLLMIPKKGDLCLEFRLACHLLVPYEKP